MLYLFRLFSVAKKYRKMYQKCQSNNDFDHYDEDLEKELLEVAIFKCKKKQVINHWYGQFDY